MPSRIAHRRGMRRSSARDRTYRIAQGQLPKALDRGMDDCAPNRRHLGQLATCAIEARLIRPKIPFQGE
jgi:hypothetical protein